MKHRLLFNFQNNQETFTTSLTFRKKQQFIQSIRNQQKNQKINDLRKINFFEQYKHIQPLVKALPNSMSDLIYMVSVYPESEKMASKAIIDFVYPFQFSTLSKQQNHQSYRLIINAIQTKQELVEQFYLFGILFQHQGSYSEVILKRYFNIIFLHCKQLREISLIFKAINIILKNDQINWVPVNQIIQLIKYLTEKNEEIYLNQQIEMYKLLAKDHYTVILDTNQIYDRINQILKVGSNVIQQVKSQTFFNLCLNLTYYQTQNLQKQSQNKIISFYESIQKGGIIKIIYRNMFFGSKQKIKLICIDLLTNIISELGSQILWKQQKLNHIEYLAEQIYDKNNNFKVFRALCHLYLVSIIKIPSKELFQNFIEGEIDNLQLMFYIIENLQNDHQIKQMVMYCLQILFKQIEKIEQRRKICYKLQDKKWQHYLQNQDNILKQIQKYLNQSEQQDIII